MIPKHLCRETSIELEDVCPFEPLIGAVESLFGSTCVSNKVDQVFKKNGDEALMDTKVSQCAELTQT